MLDDFGLARSTPGDSAPALAEAFDRRDAERHLSVLRIGKLTTAKGQELCVIRNISAGGLMAQVYTELALGDHVSVELKTGETVAGKVVWARDHSAGVAFTQPIDVSEVLASQPEGDLQPRAPRLDIKCWGRVRVGARYHRVEVHDISQDGAKITPGGFVELGDEVVLMIEGFPPRPGVIRWQQDDRAGIFFVNRIPLNELALWARAKQ